jgi:hypothetical protein
MKLVLMPSSSFLCSATPCKSRTGERWCDFENGGMKIICKEAYFEGLGKPIKNFILSWMGFDFRLTWITTLFCSVLLQNSKYSRQYLFSVTLMFLHCKKIMRSLCKVHKINARCRWVETVKGTFHSTKKYADFDEIWYWRCVIKFMSV